MINTSSASEHTASAMATGIGTQRWGNLADHAVGWLMEGCDGTKRTGKMASSLSSRQIFAGTCRLCWYWRPAYSKE